MRLTKAMLTLAALAHLASTSTCFAQSAAPAPGNVLKDIERAAL